MRRFNQQRQLKRQWMKSDGLTPDEVASTAPSIKTDITDATAADGVADKIVDDLNVLQRVWTLDDDIARLSVRDDTERVGSDKVALAHDMSPHTPEHATRETRSANNSSIKKRVDGHDLVSRQEQWLRQKQEKLDRLQLTLATAAAQVINEMPTQGIAHDSWEKAKRDHAKQMEIDAEKKVHP